MTGDEAAWVRDHVLPTAIRKDLPQGCPCQIGLGRYCGPWGDCSQCAGGSTVPICETYITDRAGLIRAFDEPYHHPFPSATGVWPTRYAMVWLADRACRWRCPHSCHPIAIRYEVVTLPGFELAGSSR